MSFIVIIISFFVFSCALCARVFVFLIVELYMCVSTVVCMSVACISALVLHSLPNPHSTFFSFHFLFLWEGKGEGSSVGGILDGGLRREQFVGRT